MYKHLNIFMIYQVYTLVLSWYGRDEYEQQYTRELYGEHTVITNDTQYILYSYTV